MTVLKSNKIYEELSYIMPLPESWIITIKPIKSVNQAWKIKK